jgi:hypothetical protein
MHALQHVLTIHGPCISDGDIGEWGDRRREIDLSERALLGPSMYEKLSVKCEV